MKPIGILLALLLAAATAPAGELTLRMGQGGFRDGRAPDDTLGGGQLCLDWAFDDRPLVLSIAGEYFTNGPDPSHVYEIDNLISVHAYYRRSISERWPTYVLLGGGPGWLTIGTGEDALALQAIASIHTKIVWRLRGYAEGKHLYSQDGAVDFSEAVLQLGISIHWSW